MECGKYIYRGIGLLENGMKLFEKVLESLRKLIKVDCQQFGFCPGRSTTDAIFTRQLQEKFSEKRRN